MRLDDVYLHRVHAQNPVSMEHASLTTRVCVTKAGMEGCVMKVSDKKLTKVVQISLWLIIMPLKHKISTEVELI